jgi:hypothetical protein
MPPISNIYIENALDIIASLGAIVSKHCAKTQPSFEKVWQEMLTLGCLFALQTDRDKGK